MNFENDLKAEIDEQDDVFIENNSCVDTILTTQSCPRRLVENPDFSWMWRLIKLQKAKILRENQTQYELACLSTMGGAYSICRFPREALQIARRQEQVGIRVGSIQIQCHAKLYQYINLTFLGRKKAGLKMLQAAKKQAEDIENTNIREHCDVTENWLNNEIKYKHSKYQSKSK